jgi:hypothetical protein
MLTRFRNIAYVLAYAVATIPLWHYIRDGRILALMVAVVIFAYINVVLSTVHAAQPILSSEKAKIPLPRWLPDKPKYEKWWLLVRGTLKWHLLLIPPKMGLALGFVHWLHIGFGITAYASGLLNPYYYTSWNTSISPLYPQAETIIVGIVTIILFTVFELGLLSSIVISAQAKLINVIVKKLVIIFLLIGISTMFSTILWFKHSCYYTNCRSYLYSNFSFSRRLDDTFIVATNSLSEQGVLLAANVMRPTGYDSEFTAHWRNVIVSWDNRPFVARQIVAGLLGLLLYAGATWIVLWFVEDEI